MPGVQNAHPGTLGFLNKFFLTLGAGNRNFALAPGHTHRLLAARTLEIPMVPVLDLFQKLQILPVFPIALIGVPGKAAEDRPTHQNIGDHRQNNVYHTYPDKHSQQTCHKSCHQNCCVQLIGTVATLHKSADAFSKLSA